MTKREGRLVTLYHSIAMAVVAVVVYMLTAVVPMDKYLASTANLLVTAGYLIAVFNGFGFAYFGHNYTLHGLFLLGLSLIFFSGLNYYHSGDQFETAEGYSDTTPVGFYNGNAYGDFHTEDATSPYGLYDMAGNVGEWTGDKISGYHYRRIRGGSKATYEIDSRVWKYDSATPEFVSPALGFRCVRDV